MGAMIQAQQSQQQTTSTHSAQAVCSEFYKDLVLAELMGYALVYIETGIPIIWGKFQMSKEFADNCQ